LPSQAHIAFPSGRGKDQNNVFGALASLTAEGELSNTINWQIRSPCLSLQLAATQAKTSTRFLQIILFAAVGSIEFVFIFEDLYIIHHHSSSFIIIHHHSSSFYYLYLSLCHLCLSLSISVYLYMQLQELKYI
jgi:hypothetical protein